ncbi:hypothetical protein B0T26DRAFT_741181 [Lasiosphaeria miniovina]|uniref:non-specific serine/threonine protein kinase n=1 Tax=Lasiosphaeria miniovina TaxID=1954250 RepID=A0AA40ALL4_9PEZI|nr:uncharacterized protein B0T26DRAFT_741181 [Lasiosphaeria miniovina]KAK0718106.1 hypothetical protein B0T26DRAFT_741181 [Lasiosphaeria miniovina]
MADQQSRLKIINDNPIGKGLDAFRTSFTSICEGAAVSCTPDALEQLGQKGKKNLAIKLIAALQGLQTSLLLPSNSSTLDSHSNDILIWKYVYDVTEPTPPPRPVASSLQQTPSRRTTSSLVNSSEYHDNIDPVLKSELGLVYVDVRRFREAYFGGCMDSSNPLFGSEGWSEWPAGSRGKRSVDIGFVKDDFTYDPTADPTAGKVFRYHLSHALVPGELKSNPSADIPSIAMISIATYAREVLSAQDTRRFVLGFTLCGSYMRIYAFDRLRAIASEKFDINKEGQQFVSTILGFLWMNEEELGFDPTFMTANVGRATTCWKARREEDPQNPLVIKDSWQWPNRDEEGDLLREATGKGVVKVALYYHHETGQVNGMDDDIGSNVRKGLDITSATNYGKGRSVVSPSTSAAGAPRKGQSSSATGTKRSYSQAGAPLPPSKRSGSAFTIKAGSDLLLNRIHRRVILRDYGKPIYKASSRAALLTALEGCIKGHESLYMASLLHRDISINNLMINEDENNPSLPSFLIDLDLAVRVQQEGASGAKGKTGTRAFMAIGALQGEPHSFMHDLESFFWVLFWTCIRYNAQGKDIGSTGFDSWNYQNDHMLVQSKKGEIDDEEDFIKSVTEIFTLHYQPLIPWVSRLRRKVFPDGKRWKRLEPELYSSMKQILRDARKDPEVLADSIM